MTWLDAWAQVLLGLGVFVVPGLLLVLAAGLRGWWLWAAAPAVGLGAIAALSVLFSFAGIGFSRVAVGLAVALVAVVVYAVRRVCGWSRATETLHLGLPWFTAVGLVVAAVLAAVGAATGMVDPDAVPQAWDAVFHLNAVRYVLDTGDASPLHLGTLTMPLKDVAIYPSAWHAVTALTVIDSPAVAANVVSILVAAVVFLQAAPPSRVCSHPGRGPSRASPPWRRSPSSPSRPDCSPTGRSGRTASPTPSSRSRWR